MADDVPKLKSEIVAALTEEHARTNRIEQKLGVLAALRLPITAAEVNLAREEYVVHLDWARDAVRRRDSLELIEAANTAAEVCRTRYEYLSTAFRAQSEEANAHEARELAKTNTELARSQTRIARAVAAFTLFSSRSRSRKR